MLMSLRRPGVFVAVACVGWLASAAGMLAADPAWRDATRDVYIDGRLDRSAQVLVEEGSRRSAIVSPQRRSF